MRFLSIVLMLNVLAVSALAQTDSYILKDDGGDPMDITVSTLIYEDDTNNRIGIGTTAPDAKLHVSGSAVLESSSKKLWIYPNVGSVYAAILTPSGSDMELRLGTNDTARLTIDTSGDIGIGTTAPGERLDVSGGDINISSAGYGIKLWSPDGNTCRLITIDNSGDIQNDACP